MPERWFAVFLAVAALSQAPAAGQGWREESELDRARQPIWQLSEWGEETPRPRALREEYGVVSTVELRNPLRGRSLRTIQRAVRDLEEGRRGRALEDLRGALSDPVARPHALCLLGTSI